MSQTAERMNLAVAELGRQAGKPGEAEARAELLVAKIQYRSERMLASEPPLSDEHRTQLCAFFAEVGR